MSNLKNALEILKARIGEESRPVPLSGTCGIQGSITQNSEDCRGERWHDREHV